MVDQGAGLPARATAAISACVATIFAALSVTGPWEQFELKGFDALTVLAAPGETSLPITIVAIDEPSMKQIGLQLPWPRSMHAKLIDELSKSGALVIALDVLLSEASKPEEDRILAAAIARAGNVVIAADFVYQESKFVRQWVRVDPIPEFMEAGATKGYALVTPDPDLVIRRVPEGADVFWREIVRRANERQPGLLALVEPAPGAMIRYRGRDRTFPYVPYYQALQASTHLPPDAFKDQIVIVGSELKATTQQGRMQSDLFPTPFTSSTRWLTPGAELHANILETMLRGDAVRPAPGWWSLALVLATVTLCAFAMRRWRPVWSGVAALAVITALAALAAALFMRMDVWLPVFGAMSSAAAIYVSFGGVAFLTERRRKGEIRRAFSLYMSPEVVDHVMAHPEQLKLGGERREVTMFFSDLKDFTPMAERLGAEQVARVLNQHFTRATAIIKRHNGTVNRFIGDAIMAMWGAPLDDPRQAENAVRAAVEIQEDMKLLRTELVAQGLPEVYMRIGIHTCVAVIGNLGSSDRFDYTAIGDGVNLTARLEGVNKLYGTGVLVSGDTVAKMGGAVAVRRVDRVIVKGKSEPVDIFTPCADAALNEASERAFAALCARRWEESENISGELLAGNPADGIAALHLARTRKLRRAVPSLEWNGAVELEKL